MAEYKFDKYMMAGSREEIAKAYNSGELKYPCAVVMDDEFFTGAGLRDKAELVSDWPIYVYTTLNPKKSAAPIDFVSAYAVAYNGEGLKTEELTVDNFETEDGLRPMSNSYSYFPAGTGLQLMNAADGFESLWHINSKGDYVYDGTKFSFEEDTESFTITWQDNIPGDKGEIVTGFVVRTTPHTEPDR